MLHAHASVSHEVSDDAGLAQGLLRVRKIARQEGIRYLGGCCGCNAAYIRELAYGLQDAS